MSLVLHWRARVCVFPHFLGALCLDVLARRGSVSVVVLGVVGEGYFGIYNEAR